MQPDIKKIDSVMHSISIAVLLEELESRENVGFVRTGYHVSSGMVYLDGYLTGISTLVIVT